MKRATFIFAILGFTILLLGYNVALAQPNTSFTYLGYLEKAGIAVTDACDFDFSLFDVETEGIPIADIAPLTNIEVNRGTFFVTLDFGDIFNGDDRWLETAVRCPTGTGNYVTLTPRVPMNYPLEGMLPGIYPDGTGQVGINKTTPSQTLDVNGVVAATGGNSDNWNTAFSWGDHALAGYLTSETDPQVGSLSTNRVPKWSGSTLSNGIITDNSSSVGINDTSPSYRLDVNGNIRTTSAFYKTDAGSTRVLISLSSAGGGYMSTRGANGNKIFVLSTSSGSGGNHGYLAVYDSAGSGQAGIYVNGSGDGIVFGDTKNFRMENPNQLGTEIWYASLEGPEAAAYIRGTAELVNGQAVIKLPDHFLAVASPEGLTVQLTPLSAASKGLAVVSKSLDGIQVQELNGGTGNYAFDFFVTAVRQGYEDYQVVRPSSAVPQADTGQIDQTQGE
jgi:hypothetical protein